MPATAIDVLVADDSAVMRALLVRTLRLSGLPLGEVHQASTGEEGLRILLERAVHLAVVDVNMPVMDGVTMLARARDGGAGRVRAIVISSDASDSRAAAVRGQGDEFLAKPFPPEALRDAVQRALASGPRRT